MKLNKTQILIIVVLVIVVIILLVYGSTKSKASTLPGNINTGIKTSVFPLKNGSYNLQEVGKLQEYLKSKGGKNCDGSALVVDSDFGINTECATKQILGVTQVTEQMYKSLGL